MIISDSETARGIDKAATQEWGLPELSLVEAAGRECAFQLIRQETIPSGSRKQNPEILLAVGSGNNAADGLVMLKTLLLKGFCTELHCTIILSKRTGQDDSESKLQDRSPRSLSLRVLQQMGVRCLYWSEINRADRIPLFSQADLVIDALSGTGLRGPLGGTLLEVAEAINTGRNQNPNQRIIAIDVPSGLSDQWESGFPLVHSDLCLAIEPVKICLFKPAVRLRVGTIVPVTGIFPPQLLQQFSNNRLVSLQYLSASENTSSPFVATQDAYKHKRGVVRIFAGSLGTAGAPLLAGRGAQAAGAGLVQIVTDQILAESFLGVAGGLLVTCPEWLSDQETAGSRPPLKPDAVVVGPGLAWNLNRQKLLESIIQAQKEEGFGLVLDADAIAPAAHFRFDGPAIFTPHPVEFTRLLEVLHKERGFPDNPVRNIAKAVSIDPIPLLQFASAQSNAVIVLKGHVIYIAAPDGTISIVDGLEPVLAMGGSGDILSGLIGALMARMKRNTGTINPSLCGQWAVSLLIEAGHRLSKQKGFSDSMALIDILGTCAGELWL